MREQGPGVRKHSRKREAILELIRSTPSHPGAQWIYDSLKPLIPDLSLGTVYRNISLFREEGSVVSVGVVNGEERFDAVTSPHPHWVCEGCGRVLDLPRIEGELLDRLGCPERESGYVTDFRKTVFYGRCPECGSGDTPPEPSDLRVM
ncbi:MAG: transcriptional repressor [Spirochaetaceae bacterium]|nr:transcriptional repressor [Spirochaetaceae bacterium]